MSDKDNRDAARRMELAVWPDDSADDSADDNQLTKKSVKKQVGRLVECLERVTLAIQGIDVSLDEVVKHHKKQAEALPSIHGEE